MIQNQKVCALNYQLFYIRAIIIDFLYMSLWMEAALVYCLGGQMV